MRCPEAKIKEAILHPDIEIGDRATRYFAKSFSSDLSVMPLVIKAVETYGRDDKTYQLIGAARDLAQSEDTIAWVIDELNDESCDTYDSYAYNLSMLLVEAEPSLLLLRESDILEARHFQPDLSFPFTERLRMLSWDETTGFGNSECNEGSPDKWLGHLVDALEISKPVVISPSMSGQYALPLVTSGPERLRGFVAVAPVAIMDYKDRLKQITVPVLAVWGENDRLIPQEQADLLVSSAKKGRKVVIAGGSHAPYMSDAETWHKVLLEFLGELK